MVCPQGVLFRGQPEKTEEEDGQNRKPDDEYLIRRGFLQGRADPNGEFNGGVNIIDAIVVLPANLFYGTSIPGAILFFNKNKPKKRRDKVLMVYGAEAGWYKEESNMNLLMPHDVLRISTMLEAWGDENAAKKWINKEKKRLYGIIQENLAFRLGEIDLEFDEDIEFLRVEQERLKGLIAGKKKEKKKPTKTELNKLERVGEKLEKLLAKKEAGIEGSHEMADREREEIGRVEAELITMFGDPELRKRYFAIVDMAEIEENEFNLNIPRYVDTFEPEEEIDLRGAIDTYFKAVNEEVGIDNNLNKLLRGLIK